LNETAIHFQCVFNPCALSQIGSAAGAHQTDTTDVNGLLADVGNGKSHQRDLSLEFVA
jgi:hypothetical protein